MSVVTDENKQICNCIPSRDSDFSLKHSCLEEQFNVKHKAGNAPNADDTHVRLYTVPICFSVNIS